jgi:hypothetical protein
LLPKGALFPKGLFAGLYRFKKYPTRAIVFFGSLEIFLRAKLGIKADFCGTYLQAPLGKMYEEED